MLRALLLWVTNDFFYVIESSIAADFVFQRGVKVHGEPPLYLGMWVFEVMAQTEGLERKRQVITRDNQPLEEAEAFIKAFAEKTGVTMEHESTTKPGKGSAYYIPSRHLVQVPP